VKKQFAGHADLADLGLSGEGVKERLRLVHGKEFTVPFTATKGGLQGDRIFGGRRKQLNQISLFAWGNGSRSARDVERFCANRLNSFFTKLASVNPVSLPRTGDFARYSIH
jgi:hypothetical protein